MREAARTSETLVNFYQTTRCYNPEDSNLLIVRLIKARRIDMGGACGAHGEVRGAYNILVGRPEGRRLLGRPRRR
jgi:hypothetical protein